MEKRPTKHSRKRSNPNYTVRCIMLGTVAPYGAKVLNMYLAAGQDTIWIERRLCRNTPETPT
jgi:hypothetical protein